MKTLFIWIKRDVKLFFKDKGMFFTAMITPLILLILYATFLQNVYWDSFEMSLPEGMDLPESIIGATVGGELLSSLLAVCGVTVACCANMLMVQDKITGAYQDMTVSPVKRHIPAFGYYLSTLLVTLMICCVALVFGLIYLACMGWYVSAVDIALILLDVFLLSMFGTSLSSVINFFLTSQGQISAVGTIISSGYGFICGAYMPISQFPDTLQKIISFLPCTYGTSLIRNHAIRGAFEAMKENGIPAQTVELIRDSIDCNLYFFDHKVETWSMYLILGVSVLLLLGAYILLHLTLEKKKKR